MPRTNLSTSLGGTVETDIPDDVEWIDDAFYIKKDTIRSVYQCVEEPFGSTLSDWW